ncbi:MAG TPA: SseB family protein [Oscillospiraceae bacterium]|nr:SseB family protein [Oscillospiraceae bacterium]HNW04495.1 SseB family protein [Oscillospiraceae bacterium]HPW00806.1 SseB family protein [Oscillospiraceae bacterium]
MGISRKSLQDGKVLSLLLARNQTERTVESLSGVFRCLRDSQIWLALETPDGGAAPGGSAPASSGHGPVFGSGNLKPHLIQDGAGRRYLPVFSETGRMPEDYQARFTAARVSFLRCIDLMAELPGVERIAVNPFGANLILSPLQLKTIGDLPSEIGD